LPRKPKTGSSLGSHDRSVGQKRKAAGKEGSIAAADCR
jgi:hypothetical protein